MTFRGPLLILGIGGSVLFIGTGLGGVIPWVASGPFALLFLGLAVAQVREYYQTVKPKPPPKGVYQNVEEIMSRQVSLKNPTLRDAVTLQPRGVKNYSVALVVGESLTIEAGADDWISVELVSLTENQKREAGRRYYAERSKDGKNLTIEYEAKRNGNWFVYVGNISREPLEVGVTLTVE